MKKIWIGSVCICLTLGLFITKQDVKAIDFSKKESYYIKLCSSSLTSSNKKVCQDFNNYLSKKNSQLKKDIKKQKQDLSNTKDSINEISKKIDNLNSQITSKEKEINYLYNSIKKIQKNIAKKEEQMSERLYIMQSYYNSNTLIDFLLGASNFSDFFSRLNSINDITAYEKELVDELNTQKKQLNQQKSTLDTAKAALQSQKSSASALEKKLLAEERNLQNKISSTQKESNKISAAQKEIDDELTELINSLPSGDSGGDAIQGSQGNAEVGYKIAKKALSKIGSPYWWGAPGGGFGDGQGLDNPNAKYFDCSGLVAWAHRQAGVKIGRTTANAYAYSGKAISASQLQAGDIVAFRRPGSSRYHHIGIYIGNGIVVHASGEGSTCRGNHASKGHVVKRTSLSSFSYDKTYRRLY